MRRRALLAGSATLLAGCSAIPNVGAGTETTAERATPTATPTPSLPLTATDPATNVDPVRGVEVRSKRREPVYTTVVVEDGDRTLYTASGTVEPGETWRHDGLVARPGIYRVIVETETGDRAVHGWVVGERWDDRNLITSLTGDGVETEQVAICTPECPPLQARGESISLPRENPADPGPEVAGAVTLRNAGTEQTPASLRVVDAGRRLIDYTYDLPPGVSVVVPVARSVGEYDLVVAGADRRVERTWHVPEEEFPRFRLDAGNVVGDCAFRETRIQRVSNSREDTRTVGLSLRTEERGGRSETLRLGPGEERSVALRAPPGRTTLVVFVDGERRLTANWNICPGGPFRVVLVGDTVFVRNDERVVASAFAG